jgi:hypothetical protein
MEQRAKTAEIILTETSRRCGLLPYQVSNGITNLSHLPQNITDANIENNTTGEERRALCL